MKIKCHQFLHGHSTKDGYAARVLESKSENRANAARSFAYPFNDSRRDISDDRSLYILEIQPTDDSFERTAAICSQWKTEGTPSKYTHWLIPVDEKTESTMRLLKRDSFMTGKEMAEAYETDSPLFLREVEVSNDPIYPRWQMTDQQQKMLGQFLALLWISLVQNNPSKGTLRNRIPMVIRDPGSNDLLTNEKAVEFFNREIVSRLPEEAKSTLSVAFGIKWSEASTVFKKTVCVILSSETGVPSEKKVDIFKGTHDLLSKCPHNDREAMNAIGKCLMRSSSDYPEWYTRMRGLKGGIPKRTAPYIMYLSLMLEDSNQKVLQVENCHSGLFVQATNGGAEEEDVRNVLAPLVEKISELWQQQPRPTIDFYLSKRNWLLETAKMPENRIAELLEPLAEKVLTEIRSGQKLTSKQKTINAMILLETLGSGNKMRVVTDIEAFLAEYGEEVISILSEDEELAEPSETSGIKTDSLERVLLQWNKGKTARDPKEVIRISNIVFQKIPDLSPETKEVVLTELYRQWIPARVEELGRNEDRGELPTIENLRELAETVHKIGISVESEEASAKAIQFIKKHYLTWIMEEPVVIKDDKRFLSLAKEWIEENLVDETRDFDAAKMVELENNLLHVFEEYHESADNKNRSLSVFRRIKGEAQLEEIVNDPKDDKAIRIADLHNTLRQTDAVILDETDLEKLFTEKMQEQFVEWSSTKPPFTSGLNGRYTDNWFVAVARSWLLNRVDGADMTWQEMERLETSIIAAMNNYKVPREEQQTMLSGLRKKWGTTKLQDLVKTGELNKTTIAVEIAGIHNRLRKFPGVIEDEDWLESDLRRSLIEYFLFWEKAEKPFPSGIDMRYEDDWFVKVAKEWLQYNGDIGELSSTELDQLIKDLTYVFGYYHIREQADVLLKPVWVQWGEAKLRELQEKTADETIVLQIAGIHNQLRRISGTLEETNEYELEYALLQRFVIWGKCQKPFASDENLRYEDPWFESVLKKWVEDWLETEDLSSAELSELAKQVDIACRAYRIRDDAPVRKIRRRYARTFVDENTGLSAGTGSVSKTAELLFTDRAVYEDPEMSDVLIDCVAESFEQWAETTPSFSLNNTASVYAQNTLFLQILDRWQERKLVEGDAGRLIRLKDDIRAGFNTFRISLREFDQHVVRLDMAIKKGQFEEVRNRTIDPKDVATIAGTRAWIEEKRDQLPDADRTLEDIDSWLIEKMDVWLSFERPLYIEGYGYQRKFAVKLLDQWLLNGIDKKELSLKDIQDIRKAVDSVRKEYRTVAVDDIRPEALDKLNVLECGAFLKELPKGELDQNQIEETAERLLSINNEPILESQLIQTLVDHYPEWYKTRPPFSCGKNNRTERENLIIQVTMKWLEQDYLPKELSSDDLMGIVQNIQAIGKSTDLRNKEQLLDRLSLMQMELKLRELKTRPADKYTSEDVLAIAGILVKTSNRPECGKLWEDARESLTDHFALWGVKSSFRLPNEFASRYEEVDFVDLTRRWLDKLQRYPDDPDKVRDVKSRMKAAGDMYRLSSQELEELIALIENCQIEMITKQLLRTSNPSPDLIDEGFELFVSAQNRYKGQISTLYQLKEMLIKHYRRWVEAGPKTKRSEAFLLITREWLNSEFDRVVFSTLDEYEKFRGAIKKQLNNASFGNDDYENVIEIIETRWLREAIRFYETEPTSISVIAGYGKSIPATHREIDQRDRNLLERFLLDHFITWSKESYQSTDGNDLFVYPDFVSLMNRWVQSGRFKELSAEELAGIDDVLFKALTEGYGCSPKEGKHLMEPFVNRKREIILLQGKRSLDEGVLRSIRNMYNEAPEEVYREVFQVILSATRRAGAQVQIMEFVSEQANIWIKTDDEELHKGIIIFLNELYKQYSAERRPHEITDTMSGILEKIQYDLSSYRECSDAWTALKDQDLDEVIHDYMDNIVYIDELQETWEAEYSEKFSLPWNKMVVRPKFEQELRDQMLRNWHECTDEDAKVFFIDKLSAFTEETEDRTFKGLLLAITYDYIRMDFEKLYANPQYRDKLDNAILLLQRNGISTEQVTSSEIYRARGNCQQYEALRNQWNLRLAVDLLMNKPEMVISMRNEIQPPVQQNASYDEMIMMQLIFYKLTTSGTAYWERILHSQHVNLKALDNMDLGNIAATPFLSELYNCYYILISNGIVWALDELKDCIKKSAPSLWRALHPFSILGNANIWKRIGGEQLPDSAVLAPFMDWLMKR